MSIYDPDYVEKYNILPPASSYNIGDKVYYIEECEVSGLNKNVERGEDFDITIKFRNGGERETVSEKIIPIDMFQELINVKFKSISSKPPHKVITQKPTSSHFQNKEILRLLNIIKSKHKSWKRKNRSKPKGISPQVDNIPELICLNYSSTKDIKKILGNPYETFVGGKNWSNQVFDKKLKSGEYMGSLEGNTSHSEPDAFEPRLDAHGDTVTNWVGYSSLSNPTTDIPGGIVFIYIINGKETRLLFDLNTGILKGISDVHGILPTKEAIIIDGNFDLLKNNLIFSGVLLEQAQSNKKKKSKKEKNKRKTKRKKK